MKVRKLYDDFKLTEENCDVEPIHRPIAIGGHGYLFCFKESDPQILHACSENISSLGLNVDKIFNMSMDEWMDPVMLKAYQEMDSPERWNSVDPMPITLAGKRYNLIRHIHKDYRFIEIEDQESSHEIPYSTFHAIRMLTEPMARISSIQELCNHTVRQMKKVFQYDRVMVYKFDRDYHGFVMAEEKEEKLESFLGLHYPATDIPKMARDLFMINKSRIIPNVTEEKSWLKFNPASRKGDHLDLSLTQLRGTSPIHIEYLKNMGVGASLTLAIIIENQLWGLIASHHYSPKFISYEMRKSGELIANTFSQRINEIAQTQIISTDRLYRDREQQLLSNIDLSSDITTQLISQKTNFAELCEAHGCALISNVGSYHLGSTPDSTSLQKIWEYILQSEGELFATHNLSEDLSDVFIETDIPKHIGGLMAINLSIIDNTVIMWFRNSEVYEYDWGGDPSRPYEVDYLQNQEVRLSPRKSFEKWKSQITTQSEPWEENELRLAQRIREGLLKKDIEREALKSKMMRADMEQLTYVTSHDLQEPLRTVTNYLSLLSESINGDGDEEGKQEYLKYIDRTTIAAGRMKKLVVDLLDYSRTGSENNAEKTWVNANELIQQVKSDLEIIINENKVAIKVGDLPLILGNETELKQVFQNMISNAIKYRKKEVNPLIEINSYLAGNFHLFTITDNGIGISEKYYDKIFMLFQRLHGKEEYEGTGIGLAQCKKIIENMGGNIWVSSQEDEGSTFYFNIHQSLIRDKDHNLNS